MNIYDIETINENEKIIPYCICYIIDNIKSYLYYNNGSDIIIDFLNIIIKISKNNLDLYSHNINFDGMLIIESLTKKNIRFTWYIRNLNIYWIKIYFVNIEIKLRCSYKIIPLSIENIGLMINHKKQFFPYKFSSIINLNYIGKCPSIEYFDNINIIEYIEYKKTYIIFNFKEISIEYCFNDLIILNDVLKNIYNIINNYNKKIIKYSFSFSSIAYKLYKKKFDKYRICDYKLSIKEYEYIKKSYFGGRCEIFGNPESNEIVHYFDFSGMYAECMKNKFPVGKPFFKTKNLSINDIGLHAVKVYSDNDFPILPLHYNKKLLFPNGNFYNIYTHIELNYFINNGGKIIDHYSSYVFEKEEYVFSNYVEEFIDIRKKGIYYKIFGKSMNNGLYGSFALGFEDEETIIIFNEEELKTYLENTTVKSWKKINNCIVIKIIKNNLSKKFLDKNNKWSDTVDRNLIYASYISSYGRIKLYNGFKEILKNNGRVYYCDTDSFFAGFKYNNINKQMGEIIWSDVYDDAVFISPKFYYLKRDKNEEFKSKGIRNNNYSFEQIKKNFYENKEKIMFENQLNFLKKDYILMQRYLDKKISLNNYDKRLFNTDKKKTTPIKI